MCQMVYLHHPGLGCLSEGPARIGGQVGEAGEGQTEIQPLLTQMRTSRGKRGAWR